MIGPTNSARREETILARMMSGRSSPGSIFKVKLALEEPFPSVFILFTKSDFPVPDKYFSLSSCSTILDFSSIKLMIESVIFSLVPLGIVRVTCTRSLAILGKNEVRTTPPPIEPIVRKRADRKRAKVSNLFSKVN